MATSESPNPARRVLDPPRHAPARPRQAPEVTRSLLTGLRSGWPAAVVLALVLGAAAYLVGIRSATQYQASARVFLDAGVLSANGTDPVRGVLTQSELAVSPSALDQVAANLALTAKTVQDSVSTAAAPDGNYFTVRASARTAIRAADLVSATERAYQSLVTQQLGGPDSALVNALVADQVTAQKAYDAAVAASAAKPKDAALLARTAVLRAQLQALSTRENDALSAAYVNANPVQLLEQPVLPTSPTSPNPKRDALLGVLAGLVIGVGLLWWRSDRLATVGVADVHATTGLPRLAGLPRLSRTARRQPPGTVSARAGSYTDAAFAIDVAAVTEPGVLLLVGCRRGDLTPATAVGLARAFSRDRKVALVDGDRQHQELTQAMSAAGVRTGGSTRSLDSGIVALPAQSATGDCVFVPIRPAAPHDWRHYFGALTGELRNSFELVIVVGPPPDESPVAGLAAASADVTVLVVGQGTPLARIVATSQRLAELGRPVVGYVVDSETPSRGLAFWRRPAVTGARNRGNVGREIIAPRNS